MRLTVYYNQYEIFNSHFRITNYTALHTGFDYHSNACNSQIFSAGQFFYYCLFFPPPYCMGFCPVFFPLFIYTIMHHNFQYNLCAFTSNDTYSWSFYTHCAHCFNHSAYEITLNKLFWRSSDIMYSILCRLL